MALFFGIAPGEERIGPGIRISVNAKGDRAWMHGKWLDLGPEHAVVWAKRSVTFFRPDGVALRPGQFPAWVVAGRGKNAPFAVMTSITQFRGGGVRVDDGPIESIPRELQSPDELAA